MNFPYVDYFSDLLSGRTHEQSFRDKQLKPINSVLSMHGLRLTEECKPSGKEWPYEQDVVLHLEKRFWPNRWRKVCTFVPGEEYARVKDGFLPEGFSLKRTISEGKNVASYYKGNKVSVLIFQDQELLLVIGNKVHVYTVGSSDQFDIYDFRYVALLPAE